MARAALLPLAIAVVAAPAVAQPDVRVQLDEFGVGAASAGTAIEQIGSAAAPLPPEIQPTDRQMAVAEPPPVTAQPIGQLSQSGNAAEPDQLSTQAAAGVNVASVSTRGDSRPRATAALAGTDRCDPQLGREELAQCRRILERRAAEFDAPAPPVLSAEQQLMAEQDRNERKLAATSSEARLRLASVGQPDADLPSNQELASLYLDSNPAPPARAEPTPADDQSLAEVLEAFAMDVQNPALDPGQ